MKIHYEKAVKNSITAIKKEKENLTKKAIISFSSAYVRNLKKSSKESLSRRLSADYNREIRAKVEENSFTVWLEGEKANDIETGKAPFDMKPSYLKSSKAKTGKNGGKYLIVPISKKHNINRAPKAIQGLGQGDIAKDNRRLTRKRVSRMGKVFGDYKHKVGRLNNALVTGVKGKTIFTTSFRTVSSKSSATSWINKGYKKHNLFKKALTKTRNQFKNLKIF